MNLGGSRKESAALDACRLSGTTAPARRNRSLSAHTALYLLRSLPPVIVPNGIPAVPVSGFNAKIPMTENCASFAFPLYRDGKIARVLLSRYIGTGKLREFWRPEISALQNCVSFAFPKYPRSKTVSEIVRRQCLRRFRRHSSSFSFHN